MKSLYDLKQLERPWNQNIIAFNKSIGFKQLNGDPNISIQQTKDQISIVSVCIHEFFLASKIIATLEVLEKLSDKKYEIKDLGNVKTIIDL